MSDSNPVPSRLDPDDPAAFRAVAHTLLDACLDRLENVRDRPWIEPGDALPGDDVSVEGRPGPPRGGLPIERIAAELADEIMPRATGNTHPRFFGWVHGTGLASGLLAEMVAATMNSNCGGRRHVAIDVERRVIEWCATLHGLPEGAGGLVTGGTSMATLLALCAARVRAFGESFREEGTNERSIRPVLYAAMGAHQCVSKACEVMGLGRGALRQLPLDPDTRSLSIPALTEAVAADRAAGYHPFCLVGTAGSVNVGRFDDLAALADAAAEHDLWLHVDGAFGAWAVLADPPWNANVAGLERADSIAFDFHKWPYVQYEAGAVLVRDAATLPAAFSGNAAYLVDEDEGLAAGAPWPCDLGLELSRGFRALKVWTALRAHGTDALGAAISDNCRQAALMGELVEAASGLRLAAPVTLNVCCFALVNASGQGSGQASGRSGRQGGGEPADEAADERHRAIAAALQLAGDCVLSTTRLDGRTVLRAAIVNHRTADSDIRFTIEAVLREAGRQREVA